MITIILEGSLEILEKKRHILLHILLTVLLTIILQYRFSQNREKRNLIIIIWNGNFE